MSRGFGKGRFAKRPFGLGRRLSWGRLRRKRESSTPRVVSRASKRTAQFPVLIRANKNLTGRVRYSIKASFLQSVSSVWWETVFAPVRASDMLGAQGDRDMRTSTLLRWLVVVVSAAMLLAVAAACGTETGRGPRRDRGGGERGNQRGTGSR